MPSFLFILVISYLLVTWVVAKLNSESFADTLQDHWGSHRAVMIMLVIGIVYEVSIWGVEERILPGWIVWPLAMPILALGAITGAFFIYCAFVLISLAAMYAMPHHMRKRLPRDSARFSARTSAMIGALFKSGNCVNTRNENGRTRLHLAVVHNKSPVHIGTLIGRGADPNASDTDGNTPLHEAAWSLRRMQHIAALIECGADPNARNKNGETPLHRAAIFEGTPENIAALSALIEAGADPNARDERGETPLHEPARYNRTPETINALIEAGANPNARDKNGNMPLHYAGAMNEEGEGAPSVIAELIKAGDDPNARNNI